MRVPNPPQATAQPPLGSLWRYLRSRERVNVDLRYDYRQPFKRKNRLSTLVVSFVARCVVVGGRLRYRITIAGDFPMGGCVAVSLHASYLDAVVPVALDSRVTPVVSALCLRNKTRAWFLENYGVIWAGAQAITQGAEVVRAGKICWLAPHGFAASRHGTSYAKARLGAARVAQMAGRPVVGVIVEVGDAGPRRRMRIGITHPVWPGSEETPRQFTDRFMSELVHLSEGAQ